MSMQRTILTWGLLSGAVLGGMMVVTIPFAEKVGFERAEIFGYTTMVLAALMIFFGIRSYRENVALGSLTFGRGLLVGAGIALVAAICYVVVWMAIYYTVFPNFYDDFATHMLDKAKADGASAEALAKVSAQAEQIREISGKPLLVAAMTFAENFPLGLVAALLSAGLLRRRAHPAPEPRTAPAPSNDHLR
jgi:hypothetical protein